MSSIRILPIAALVLLSGCVQRGGEAPQTEASELFAQPLLADSALRTRARLYVALVLPEGGHAQVAVDCGGQAAELLYLDGAQRVYGGQVNRYADPVRLSADKVATLLRNPEIAALCQRTIAADWREIAHSDQGETLLLDRNSIVDQPPLRTFWSGQSLVTVTRTPTYQAPVVQWREHFTADCAGQRFAVGTRYAVDAQGRVTDGTARAPTVLQPFAAATEIQRSLLQTACDRRDALLGAPVAREVAVAPAGQAVPTPVAQPVTAINALRMSAPGITPQHLMEEGDSRFRGQRVPYREELQISPLPTNGLLRLVASNAGRRSEAVSWRGLIDLVRTLRLDTPELRVEEEMRVTQLHFVGDWRQLKVGSQLGYRLQQEISNSLKGNEQLSLSINCEVIRERAARELLAGLSGQTRELSCHSPEAQGLRSTWWYLQDYGFFYQTQLTADADNRLEKRLVRLE